MSDVVVGRCASAASDVLFRVWQTIAASSVCSTGGVEPVRTESRLISFPFLNTMFCLLFYYITQKCIRKYKKQKQKNSMAMCVLESINDGLEYTGTLCINRLRFDMEATLVTSGSHRVWPVPTSLEWSAC